MARTVPLRARAQGSIRLVSRRTVWRRTVRSPTVTAVPGSFFERAPELMPLARLVPWTGAALARHLQRAVAEFGLTPTSLGVLDVLADRHGLSHRELAARLGLTPATLTPVLDALEAGGDLQRERDPSDRRVVRLSITTRGRERQRTASARVSEVTQAALPHPPPEQVEIIRSYLLAVLAAVGDDEDR